jgi:catalase
MKKFGILLLIAISAGCADRCTGQQHLPSTPVRDPNDDPKLDKELVDSLNTRYGVHPGFRSNHAKGLVVDGSFQPTPEAAELTRSPIYAGARLAVTVRFSNASGLPNLADGAEVAKPHGMSIKFHLRDGAESDIVANSLKFFTVATGEDFRDLQLAAATSPPGQPKSAQFEAFLKSHPSVEKANATLGTPDSYAHEQYNGIDAFVFVNQAGQKQAFRYIIAPDKIVHLSKEEAKNKSHNFLADDLSERLAKGPVTFRLKAQLAAPGDQTKDPTQPWPENRKVVELGAVTITKTVSDSDVLQKELLFTPGRLTDGIELSDDPLISARDGSYADSFRQRRSAPTPTGK